MRKNNVEFLIYIKGQKPAIEYTSPRDFQTYIEGRDGSEFEIEVVNNNPFRIEAVVSVDGLSVLTGKTAGADSHGYVVPAHGRVRIPGWVVNSGKAAKFEFAGRKDGSYVEQSTGEPTNKGVIGLMVFEEMRSSYFANNAFGGNLNSSGIPRNRNDLLRARGISGEQMKSSFSSAKGMASNNARSDAMWTANATSSSQLAASASATSASAAALSAQTAMVGALSTEPVKQTLGTAFGEATEFHTTKVTFNRGDMQALIAIYYDDKRGLERRGVQVVRPSQARYQTRPSPFPNLDDGCSPPSGWNG